MMLGRETKILLALLGTLSSGFVGVLGSKLFVPRPPMGAGPDVHLPAREHEDGPIVEPPSFDRLNRSMFSATDPLSGDTGAGGDEGDAGMLLEPSASAFAGASEDLGVGDSRFAAADPIARENGAAFSDDNGYGFPRSGPLDEAEEGVDSGIEQAGMLPADDSVAAASYEAMGQFEPSAEEPYAAVVGAEPPGEFVPVADVMPIASGGYVVSAADTWWDIAERAYGDGRYYKPLFAWNRSINPRVSLAPGTQLELPPLNALTTAHAELVPTDLAMPSQPSPVVQTSTLAPAGDTVVVRPGDTLISIAREQLGASSRWRELYEANRETLGRSPGPLTPGTQLVLP
jgi:nucleoid-associated protein YgaU